MTSGRDDFQRRPRQQEAHTFGDLAEFFVQFANDELDRQIESGKIAPIVRHLSQAQHPQGLGQSLGAMTQALASLRLELGSRQVCLAGKER